MHIGLDAVMGADLEAHRMLRTGARHIAHIGVEDQRLIRRLAFEVHGGRDEGHVLDRDADLLDRRHQNIALLVLAQDRGEEPHQRGAADRRAVIEPGAVAADAHVDLTAIGRVPALDRARLRRIAGTRARGKEAGQRIRDVGGKESHRL